MTDLGAPMHHKKHSIENPALVAFPLGGIGAGMLCLEGTGGLSHVSLKNHPSLLRAPLVFSAVTFLAGKDNRTVVLEGPVPKEKQAAKSLYVPMGANWGLPRLAASEFRHAFPVASIDFSADHVFPLQVSLTGWSPFTPPDADEKLMMASYFGGMSIAYSQVGVCHALSYGLSYELGVHHGIGNSIVFNYLEEFYPEGVSEFREMLDRQGISLPRHLTADLSDAAMNRMIDVALVLAPLWENALGPHWRQQMTRERIAALYRRM